MRVAIVTSCFLSRDGLGNTIRDMVAAFTEWGHQTRVYYQRQGGVVDDEYEREPLELEELLAACVDGRAHDFFSHDLFVLVYLPYYPLMELCRFLPRGRLLVEYPGITPSELHAEDDPLRIFTAKAYEHLDLLDYADAVMVHSQSMKEELQARTAIADDRLSVIPLGVSPVFSTASPPGPRQSPPTLLYVGRLSRHKRVDLLLAALAELRTTRPAIRLIIAGMHQRTTSSSARQALSAQVSALGLDEAVEFVDGLSDLELAEQYRRASLFVTASRHEGFCLPIAEAMACGIPCVVADCTAMPETMADGGLTYPPGDVDGMVEAIARLLDDRTEWSNRAAAARERAKQFHRDRYRDRLEQLVDAVMQSPERSDKRAAGTMQLIEAASTQALRYRDRFDWPLLGPVVRWFRRKATLPLEVSCLRPMGRQQTLWNRLLLRELRRLRAEVERLKREDSHHER